MKRTTVVFPRFGFGDLVMNAGLLRRLSAAGAVTVFIPKEGLFFEELLADLHLPNLEVHVYRSRSPWGRLRARLAFGCAALRSDRVIFPGNNNPLDLLACCFSFSRLLYWRHPSRRFLRERALNALKWRVQYRPLALDRLQTEQVASLADTDAAEQLEPLSEPVTARRGVVLAPGYGTAHLAVKAYAHFESLAERLLELLPAEESVIVLGGGALDAPILDALHVRFAGNDRMVFCRDLPFARMHAVLRTARCVIANDNGIAHYADLQVKTPTVILFGPTSPAYVGPEGAQSCAVINEAASCRNCCWFTLEGDSLCFPDFEKARRTDCGRACLAISPEQILEKIAALLPESSLTHEK